RIGSDRPYERVLLTADRQLEDATTRQIAVAHDRLDVVDHLVVDAKAAAFDVAARLARRRGEASSVREGRDRTAGRELVARDLKGRQPLSEGAFFEGATGGLRRLQRCGPSMQKRSRLRCERLLRLVALGSFELLQTCNLVLRHVGEDAQE